MCISNIYFIFICPIVPNSFNLFLWILLWPHFSLFPKETLQTCIKYFNTLQIFETLRNLSKHNPHSHINPWQAMNCTELCKQRHHTVLAKLWGESGITLMRTRTNSAVCSWSCMTVRSHGVAISQIWGHCAVMWIKRWVSEMWKKNAYSTAKQDCNMGLLRCTKTQDKVSAKPKRLQSIPVLWWFLICGYWFEHSSKFSHYTIFFLYPLKNNRCSLKSFSFLLVYFCAAQEFCKSWMQTMCIITRQ